MADTPQAGETVTPEAPSNETGTTSAPVTDNRSADVEAAKREAEQARMRANQLENEIRKFREAQEAAERKILEEKAEFKTLYEQTQARLREIEESQKAQELEHEISQATESVFKDYPENVIEVAKTAGLKLADTSDTALNALKEKLDAIKSQVGGSQSPTANNPHAPAPAEASKPELVQRLAGGDSKALFELPGVKGPLDRMREIAQRGM